MTTAGQRFRDAVANEKPLQVLGAINAYAAKLAEHSGAKALYLSGGGVAASSCGIPDLGITTLSGSERYTVAGIANEQFFGTDVIAPTEVFDAIVAPDRATLIGIGLTARDGDVEGPELDVVELVMLVSGGGVHRAAQQRARQLPGHGARGPADAGPAAAADPGRHRGDLHRAGRAV